MGGTGSNGFGHKSLTTASARARRCSCVNRRFCSRVRSAVSQSLGRLAPTGAIVRRARSPRVGAIELPGVAEATACAGGSVAAGFGAVSAWLCSGPASGGDGGVGRCAFRAAMPRSFRMRARVRTNDANGISRPLRASVSRTSARRTPAPMAASTSSNRSRSLAAAGR